MRSYQDLTDTRQYQAYYLSNFQTVTFLLSVDYSELDPQIYRRLEDPSEIRSTPGVLRSTSGVLRSTPGVLRSRGKEVSDAGCNNKHSDVKELREMLITILRYHLKICNLITGEVLA